MPLSTSSSAVQGRPTHSKPELLRFLDPTFGVAQTDIARPLNPHLQGFEAFRGPPRPHSWGFEAFRGLTRPQQNPKTPSLQDYEASGTWAYNTIKRVPARPRARTNPGCLFHVKDKRILSRGWLQVRFILYSKRHNRPRRASTT